MRRSERIVRLTRTLMNHPGEPLSLTDMADQLDAAKSSLSEDLAIIRDVMDEDGEGTLRTQMGASGGVLFEVDVAWTKAQEFWSVRLCVYVRAIVFYLVGIYI